MQFLNEKKFKHKTFVVNCLMFSEYDNTRARLRNTHSSAI